jgi:wyosine [tRNA(Phe)-imidazoG37] synthetase (radical SAM superfamily)
VADLTEYKLADGVVYGPVSSRRLGASLGVNVLPFGVKVCSFNCSYCQCGWTYDTIDHATLARAPWPSPEAVEEGVAARLVELRAAGARVDAITFAGNGEPTLHPQFSACVRGVRRARDRHWPGARTDILTNGAHLERDDVVEGLNLLDARYVKLDAGSEAMFMDMNTPVTPVSLEEILANLPRLKDFTAQSMFSRGRIDNTGDADVDEWVQTCARARPRSVQVYSISRIPADPRLRPVPRERLEAIAARLRERAAIPAEVF